MEKVIITTDSGIDPINRNTMVPGIINSSNGISYPDTIGIDPGEIIERKKTGELFRTSSPSLGDLIEEFIKHINEKDVVHLSMSSGISEGSVNAANVAADILNINKKHQIYVIDTLTGAAGGTLINEYAKSFVEQGLSAKEIIEKLNDLKKRLLTSYYVPDTTGFIYSGRDHTEIGTKSKLKIVGADTLKLLGFKARVDFNTENGTLAFKSLYRGQTNKQLQKWISDIVNPYNVESFDDSFFTINNMPLKNVNLEEMVTYLEKLNYFKKIIITDFNGVFTSYGCNDLVGASGLKRKVKS